MNKKFNLLALSLLVMIISFHCSDSGTDPKPTTEPPPAQVSFSNQIQPIFNANGCVSCHGGSGGLFLTSGQSYTNLINVNAQSGCVTKKRVLPNNADESVLYIRVSSNSADTQCGPNTRMPQGGNRISQESIDVFRSWINQGAKNN